MTFGVLGRNLSHTLSPELHRFFGDYEYKIYEKEPDKIKDFIKNGKYSGLNITVPYKRIAFECADRLSENAQKTKSVNTLVREADGSLSGYNTDCSGFSYLLDKNGFDVKGKKVLVLGSGGAASACKLVLSEKQANVTVVSRKGENNYDNLYLHRDADFIVNATPVGMYPNCPENIVSLENFDNLSGVIDLIYNPLKTGILIQAEKKNIKYANGLEMLAAQGLFSAEYFLKKEIDKNLIETAAKTLERQMKNIVIVGMPGSGKTSVGKRLAEILEMNFADTDEIIKSGTGRTAEEIILSNGEEVFRNFEYEAVAFAGKMHGTVISTGGGAVENEKNFYPLKQNGVIIWLKRDTEELVLSGRPLTGTKERAEKVYEMRRGKYQSFCDISVYSKKTVEDTAKAAAEKLKEANLL